MREMAGGDKAFAVTLVLTFGGHIAGTIRRIVGDMSRDDILNDPEEIDGLIWDAAMFIGDHASAWDPSGGALPWTWAERGIRSIVAAAIGHRIVADVEDLELEENTKGDGVVLELHDLDSLIARPWCTRPSGPPTSLGSANASPSALPPKARLTRLPLPSS